MQPSHSDLSPIPFDTYQTAREIYNLEHVYLRIGDQLENLLSAIDLQSLNPYLSSDAITIARVSLVTAFQYAEYISDETASNATRKRIDWKYALHLSLHFQGIPVLSLCAFRRNIFESPRASAVFDRLLERLSQIGLYPRNLRDLLSADVALTAVCKVNRLFLLDQAMRAALGMISAHDPDWLRIHARAHWFERFKKGSIMRILDPNVHTAEEEASKICGDIGYLLFTLQNTNRINLFSKAEIQALERVWNDQFVQHHEHYQWRKPGCAHCDSSRS